MRHIERGGTYVRVVDPAWSDPLDASFSRRTGGRWNPPGAFAALYLCRDVETARANARRLLEGQPFTFDDLLPERLPSLVETTVPDARYVDAVTARGLASLDLPATYPLDGRGRASATRAARPSAARLGRGRAGHRLPQRRPRRARRRRGARALRPRPAPAARPPPALRPLVPRPLMRGHAGPTLRSASMHAAFGVLAGILQLVASAPYLRDILRGSTRRNGRRGRSGRRSRSSCSHRSGRAGRPGASRSRSDRRCPARDLRARDAARRRRHEPRSSSRCSASPRSASSAGRSPTTRSSRPARSSSPTSSAWR